MRFSITLSALVLPFSFFALCQTPDQPFDISLSSPHAVDLSPYYQAAVRVATEHYRGDGDGVVIVTSSSDELGRVAVWQLWPASMGESIVGPFSPQPFTLRQ